MNYNQEKSRSQEELESILSKMEMKTQKGYQNLWDVAKAVLRGKPVLYAYIRMKKV